MSYGNCIIFALTLAEVTSWTIDLPEVRKYIFEKNDREVEKEKKNGEFIYKKDQTDIPLYYNNVEGNSKHNTKYYDDVYENTAYARQYGYESYMEKKVHNIVYNGSVYLEGLRISLENYTKFLEECNRMNLTRGVSVNASTWRPAIELPTNISWSLSGLNSSRCREVARSSELVRRLSELALWATRELQDLAYARNYNKEDEESAGMEENELVLKLAWFLDRLAHYTGYEPDPKDFVTSSPDRTTTSSTTTPAPATVVNASSELTRQMMECLKKNSSEDAVDRCRYPEPLPPLVQLMLEMNSNITGIPAMPVTSSSSNLNERVMPISQTDPVSEQSMELLVAADYRSYRTPTLHLAPTASKSVQKRSVSSMIEQEINQNVATLKQDMKPPSPIVENDPVVNFLKYFAKHKVWEGSNLKSVANQFQEFEVKNHISRHSIQKRAMDVIKLKQFRLPESQFQDLSKYIKHKPGTKYVKDEALAAKIKSTLEKMNGKPSSSKNLLKVLTKMIRPKRSVAYEKDVDLPRESGDPQGDISYYSKNKPGRNYSNNLQQALQVRAGLEQIFNTGNIEVVRRFGANYNPANPNPFLAGIIISQADFKK